MREKFCPSCGKPTEKFYDNVCKECYLSKQDLTKKLVDKVILKECKSCGKIYFNNESTVTIEDAIDKFLIKLLKNPDIKSATYRISDNKVYLTLNFKLQGLEKEEKKTLNLITKKITCKFCSLQHVGYHQAILQLRGETKIVNAMLDEVKKQIANFNRYDNHSFISKIENVTNGIDVYIGSKNIAQQISKKLKSIFKAKIKISRKLTGSISGKKVYKNTILVSVSE